MDALASLERIGINVLLPGDARYDEARRTFNGPVDRRLAAIAAAG